MESNDLKCNADERCSRCLRSETSIFATGKNVYRFPSPPPNGHWKNIYFFKGDFAVEVCFTDGSICSFDTIVVENEIPRNMYERSELDQLIYNDPLAYADLILSVDPEVYLKTVTEYKPLD